MSEPESGPGAPHTDPELREEELGQPRPPELELEAAREEPQVSEPEAPGPTCCHLRQAAAVGVGRRNSQEQQPLI